MPMFFFPGVESLETRTPPVTSGLRLVGGTLLVTLDRHTAILIESAIPTGTGTTTFVYQLVSGRTWQQIKVDSDQLSRVVVVGNPKQFVLQLDDAQPVTISLRAP